MECPKWIPEVIGAKIVNVRWMTQAEKRNQGWDCGDKKVVVIELDNGVKLFPSMDEEGNDGGEIFGEYRRKPFYLWAGKVVE